MNTTGIPSDRLDSHFPEYTDADTFSAGTLKYGVEFEHLPGLA